MGALLSGHPPPHPLLAPESPPPARTQAPKSAEPREETVGGPQFRGQPVSPHPHAGANGPRSLCLPARRVEPRRGRVPAREAASGLARVGRAWWSTRPPIRGVDLAASVFSPWLRSAGFGMDDWCPPGIGSR